MSKPEIDDRDDPELNPLLNPLLNENMGRWAEVYFTSPPQQRKRAVRALVRELEARQWPDYKLSSRDREGDSQSYSDPQTEETQREPSFDLASFRAPKSVRLDPDRSPRESALNFKRYRVYAGLVLVIGVLGAAYLGWRGSDEESVKSMPAAAPPAKSTPAQPRTANSEPGLSPRDTQAAAVPDADASGRERELPAHLMAPTPASLRQALRAPKGSEELAVARLYLNRTGGKPYDAGEAVKWLWIAVGKQNTEATEILADLYLKGEGIPKNCEQARTLLDAAASRGGKHAADRLNHLQDLGCD